MVCTLAGAGKDSMNIVIPLADGFEETEAIAPIDILRRAGYTVVTAGLGKAHALGSHSIHVTADRILSELNPADFDAIVLPGGPGTKNLRNDQNVIGFVRAIHAKGGMCAAICAAPTVLAAAGIIEGRRVTCFPGEEDNLGGAVFTGSPIEVDGMIVTGKAAGSAISFGLAIVAVLSGKDAADDLRKRLHVHWIDV
jgi:protein deglycase